MSTHALVHALTKKIQDSGATLDAQAIGNACYGLRNLDGSHASTHALVGALANKIRVRDDQLRLKPLAMHVMG